jgi:hypothetical protein
VQKNDAATHDNKPAASKQSGIGRPEHDWPARVANRDWRRLSLGIL